MPSSFLYSTTFLDGPYLPTHFSFTHSHLLSPVKTNNTELRKLPLVGIGLAPGTATLSQVTSSAKAEFLPQLRHWTGATVGSLDTTLSLLCEVFCFFFFYTPACDLGTTSSDDPMGPLLTLKFLGTCISLDHPVDSLSRGRLCPETLYILHHELCKVGIGTFLTISKWLPLLCLPFPCLLKPQSSK